MSARFAALGLMLVAGCAVRPTVNAPTHLSGTSPLVDQFKQAAAEADVPADFLAAWAHMETRFAVVAPIAHDGDDVEGHLESFGVMGLTREQLEKAAALTGDAPSLIRADTYAGIRAVAFMMREAADTHGRIEGDLDASSSPLAWAETIALARNIQDEGMRDEYVRMLADAVGQGLTGTDDRGLTIVIEGRGEIHVPARQVIQSALDPQDPYSARYVASPNYSSRGGVDIDTIVIHTTQGSYAGTVSWFQNSSAQVSAHYTIRSSDGQITQQVRLENKAWHAGNSNYNARSIGIEHEGFVADPGRWYTEAMYTKSARLVRWLADRYNVPIDRTHIIGHYQVPRSGSGGACSPSTTSCGGSGGHTDPGNGGTGWNWSHYLDLVRGTSGGGTTGGGGTTTTDRRLVGVAFNQAEGSTARITGATIKLLRNGTQIATTTSNSTGFWAFTVSSGTYTIKATASGFQEATRDGAASAAGDNWASIGLTPTPPAAQTGTYRGVVYSGATVTDGLVEGATVRISSGQTYTTGADGKFVFTLPVGDITATATKTGYRSGSVMRTVTAGATVWGSIQILREETAPIAQPPGAPNAISPVDNVELDGEAVALSFSRVTDPQNADVTYELEVHAGATIGMQPLLSLEAPQSATSPVVVHVPVALDPGAFAWRVRAVSVNGRSAWSPTALFRARAPIVEEPGTSSSGSDTSFETGGDPEEGNASSGPAPSSSSEGNASSTSASGPTQQGAGGDAPPVEQKDDTNGPPFVGGCSATDVTRGGAPLMGMFVMFAGMLLARRRR